MKGFYIYKRGSFKRRIFVTRMSFYKVELFPFNFIGRCQYGKGFLCKYLDRFSLINVPITCYHLIFNCLGNQPDETQRLYFYVKENRPPRRRSSLLER